MSTQPNHETGKMPEIALPACPGVAVSASSAALVMPDGEIRICDHQSARRSIAKNPVMCLHAPYTAARLDHKDLIPFDVLELFAFIHPGRFCVPSPVGLCNALQIEPPKAFEDYAMAVFECATALMQDLQLKSEEERETLAETALIMGLNGKGWAWTPYIFASLGRDYDPQAPLVGRNPLKIWTRLPEWAESPPAPPPAHHPVSGDEAATQLAALLKRRGANVEDRPAQLDYTRHIAAAFAPVEEEENPRISLAEAGTGVGKTLGYLAPASVWAGKNEGAVWISTYTKNLQRQIGEELRTLYPDPDIYKGHVAVRKGRENYLCLLNFEDLANAAPLAHHPKNAIAAGIMARWAATTEDGDLTGADFPGWLTTLLGFSTTLGLADKRGECIYSACDHYHRCFVERAVRKAHHADMVVANHALVMIQTAMAGPGDQLPNRYIFDEGHHLFEAADSAFGAHLTGRETYDLRRWLLGAEGGRRSRARGLQRRVEDLIADDDQAQSHLSAILHKARALAGEGWHQRLRDDKPQGAVELFLAKVRDQVFARAQARNGPYSIETETRPLIDGLAERARALKGELSALATPMTKLSTGLLKRLNEDEGTLNADTRRRMDAVARTLQRKTDMEVRAWIAMLETLESAQTPEGHIDWMEVERIEGQIFDLGLYRHYVDPMKPFAGALRPHAHGVAVTSATLRDSTGGEDEDWRVARERTGADYLSDAPDLFRAPSPFNYARQTRVIVITDIPRDRPELVASAYHQLFAASGGGALGLFTAIQRLRQVHEAIAPKLERADIPVYAQHIDGLDSGTLVDMFRTDHHACLLGTDAMRDGVDVPGESLRLLVFDRVPWPRPTILHKARRNAFGKRRYDELITRLKLKQAYGRLIRKSDDKGVFVMLDPGLPSRLCTAFPPDVDVQRLSLDEAALEIGRFLGKEGQDAEG